MAQLRFNKRNIQLLTYSLGLIFILVAFQNCSAGSGFKTTSVPVIDAVNSQPTTSQNTIPTSNGTVSNGDSLGTNTPAAGSTTGNTSSGSTTTSNNVVSPAVLGTVVMMGYGGLNMVSVTNGLTWINPFEPTNNITPSYFDENNSQSPGGKDNAYLWRDVHFANGVFISAGFRIQRSIDGIHWTPISLTSTGGAVVNNNGIYPAPNANNTVVGSNPTNDPWANQWMGGVTYGTIADGTGVWVAVGGQGQLKYSTNNGLQWSAGSCGGCFSDFRHVVYGNGKFVAYGNIGTLRVSTDGQTWSNFASSSAGIYSNFGFGNGKFYALKTSGSSKLVYQSSDFTTWSQVGDLNAPSKLLASDSFTTLSYSGGELLFATNSGNLYQSLDDGISWIKHMNVPTSSRIVKSNGNYISFGWLDFAISKGNLDSWVTHSTNSNSFGYNSPEAVAVAE